MESLAIALAHADQHERRLATSPGPEHISTLMPAVLARYGLDAVEPRRAAVEFPRMTTDVCVAHTGEATASW